MSLQLVRGTRDLFETELTNFRFITNIAEKIASLYGYQPIETPIFEYTSVFQRTLGETSDIVGKEMYTFEDRSGDSITLRPEGTAPVMRAIISAGLTQTLPQKRLYAGPMFRYERPQKGRYRQFYQIGAECIGSSNFYSDVECIALASQILNELGISDYTLHISTLGDTESRSAYRQALIDHFSRYKEDLSEDSKNRLHRNPLRILDSKDLKDREICSTAPLFDHYLTNEAQSFFNSVKDGLTIIGINFVHDPFLVRGLDYYCHTAFEFKTKSLGAQDTILAGGRYDGLSNQMGGPSNLPSVGWAMGIDRVLFLLAHKAQTHPFRVAVIPVGEELQNACLILASNLRQVGIATELILNGNMGKKLKQADKMGCRFALLLGSDELKSDAVKVKDLQSSSESNEKEKLIQRINLISYLTSFNK